MRGPLCLLDATHALYSSIKKPIKYYGWNSGGREGGRNLIHHDQCLHVTIISFES